MPIRDDTNGIASPDSNDLPILTVKRDDGMKDELPPRLSALLRAARTMTGQALSRSKCPAITA